MNEREVAREQRRQARASLTKKQLEKAAQVIAESPAPLAVPDAFSACEECLATLEARPPSHNSDLLKHAQHKQDFWNWLQSAHANPAASTPNGAR